jgi:kynurenine formamidase
VENQIIEFSKEFDSIPKDCDMLLIKTGFQDKRHLPAYWANGPGLSPELAKWIRRERPFVKVLGFDFISITSFNNRPLGRLAHKEFLGVSGLNSPLRVIEDMKLDEVTKSPLVITIAPLLVGNADGSPVTVFANV